MTSGIGAEMVIAVMVLYKGIASDAELVLLKVQDEQQRISATNICKALKWVLRNHNKYNIRIKPWHRR